MINISVNQRFKSLVSTMIVQLPDFTIISGINGAGKSHLLQAIDQNVATVTNDLGDALDSKRYINSTSLAPSDTYQVTRESLKNEISSIYSVIQNYVNSRRNNNHNNQTFEQSMQYNKDQYKLIMKIAKKLELPFEELTLEDINDNFPITHGIVNDIFYQNFSQVFKRYYDKYEDNLFKKYLSETRNSQIRYLTNAQFIEIHKGAPWDFVNQVFEEANLDYKVNDPLDNDRDLPFTFRLINKTNGANVNFSDLSSGEKVLMSLTLSLYNSKFDVDFPKLLLLDEPDAPLHPSMAKQLLQVINEVFVKDKGVKVIMTTHSPSTIAMAPEESLYIMQKGTPRIQKSSKEHIMKLLTDGIPSFSIYADNRRQVFTESQVDANFYNKVYEKVKRIVTSDNSLYFISSGVAKSTSGNCDQVKNVVKLLRDNGNQTVFGIVDWDMTNINGDGVYVLGESKRYSLENYIFDPIFLSMILIKEMLRPRSYFNMKDEEHYYDISKMPITRVQEIVDVVINEIRDEINPDSNSTNIVTYHNGISLIIPVWYLRCQGHQLESVIRKVYPQLNRFKTEQIVDKIFDDHQGFISFDIIDLFQSLQS